MDVEKKVEQFYALVYPSHPNQWEVEEVLGELSTLPEKYQRLLLDMVPAIWPVSNSLCFSFLSEGTRVFDILPEVQLSEWVRQILYHYENGGLRDARSFMANVEDNFLKQYQGNSEIYLEEHRSRLITFSRGISGKNVDVNAGSETWTDTQTIYVPQALGYYSEKKSNELLYTLLVAIQWSLVAIGTFKKIPEVSELENISLEYDVTPVQEAGKMDDIFTQFPDVPLSRDLYLLMEGYGAIRFLVEELPGLWRRSQSLRSQIELRLKPMQAQTKKTRMMFSLFTWIFNWNKDVHDLSVYSKILAEGEKGDPCNLKTLHLLYQMFEKMDGEYVPCDFAPFLGSLRFEEAQAVIEKERSFQRDSFIALLAEFLNSEQESGGLAQRDITLEDSDSASVIFSTDDSNQDPQPLLILNNEQCKLPDEIAEMAKQIEEDLGTIPDAYVASAAGMAGKGRFLTAKEAASEGEGIPSGNNAVSFHEWDYRRGGYRQDWCSVYLKEIATSQSTFVASTLGKYRGQLGHLRRQFEMMRTHERFARRRRHGDDIDLDAVIDSLGDIRAGLPPSERLFIRLLRDERDIASLFLVDMSNSTEGWVGARIKEALVLMCEAMEIVGDRYGIYGFSGMRRSRCEVFHLKDIGENYNSEIRERIGSISPREYTRMGPPLRYLSEILAKVDARVRLLIILSDGKPEDYDDYKGKYAIEDTKKALAEARGIGLKPFCITIDQQAHDYLEYMYGRNNYCFVQKIDKLPAKLTEIYRNLTR